MKNVCSSLLQYLIKLTSLWSSVQAILFLISVFRISWQTFRWSRLLLISYSVSLNQLYRLIYFTVLFIQIFILLRDSRWLATLFIYIIFFAIYVYMYKISNKIYWNLSHVFYLACKSLSLSSHEQIWKINLLLLVDSWRGAVLDTAQFGNSRKHLVV